MAVWGWVDWLLPRLQLAWKREKLGGGALHQPWCLGRRVGLAEIEFLDAARALFDLVGGYQDLANVLVAVAKEPLQFQHPFAQAAEVIAGVVHFEADIGGSLRHP